MLDDGEEGEVTLISDEEVADLMKVMETMPPELQNNLRLIVMHLIKCYADEGTHGVLLLGDDAERRIKMFALNATEFDVTELLNVAQEAMAHVHEEDAPPREMFN